MSRIPNCFLCDAGDFKTGADLQDHLNKLHPGWTENAIRQITTRNNPYSIRAGYRLNDSFGGRTPEQQKERNEILAKRREERKQRKPGKPGPVLVKRNKPI